MSGATAFNIKGLEGAVGDTSENRYAMALRDKGRRKSKGVAEG